MPDEPDARLVEDRERIAASEAIRIDEAETHEDLNKVVRDAGVDVSRTIGPDPATIAKARATVVEARRVIEALQKECARARAAIAASERLSRRTADIHGEFRSIKEKIERRRAKRN